MPFKIVWLWSDILLWFLVFSTLGAMIMMRREPQWWSAWQQVFHSRQGIISSLVLLTFISIGLLDSIHLKFSVNMPSYDGNVYDALSMSVLDILLRPIGQQFEETYSSPFALYLFVKEMIPNGLDADGHLQFVLDYPRLLWGGDHLTHISQRAANISDIVMMAVFKACAVWLIIIGVITTYFYWQQRSISAAFKKLCSDSTKSSVPCLTTILTIGIILNILFIAKDLSVFYHIMGTDKIGIDVFYQGVKSIRTGLIIGTVTSLFMLPCALLGGMLAGYFRGWVDDVIQYIYSTLNAIPSVLLIAAAALVLQLYITQHADWFTTVEQRADARLLMLCLVLGLTNWTTLCRLLRGETLKLREADYVLVARTLGVPAYKILWRHILPNVIPLVIVVVVLDFSTFVLMEAVLSYVGVGVDASTASWGNMINRARLELARDPMIWWSLATAFILMFMLVLSANLFADKVRDAFDPKLQET